MTDKKVSVQLKIVKTSQKAKNTVIFGQVKADCLWPSLFHSSSLFLACCVSGLLNIKCVVWREFLMYVLLATCLVLSFIPYFLKFKFVRVSSLVGRYFYNMNIHVVKKV